MIRSPWDDDGAYEVVRRHVRPDGATAALERNGNHWRATARTSDGKHVEAPQPGHMGSVPMTIFLRRCVDPVSLPLDVHRELTNALNGMRLKRTERMMFDQAAMSGRVSALLYGLHQVSHRAHGEAVVAVSKRIEALRAAAIEALPAELKVMP